MRKYIKLIIYTFLCSIIFGCAHNRYKAPQPLPHVMSQYEDASFWIARSSDAKKVILLTEEIKKINNVAVRKNSVLTNIFLSPKIFNSRYVSRKLRQLENAASKYRRYDHRSFLLKDDFYENIFDSFERPRRKPMYAMITHPVSLREIPTDEIGMSSPYRMEFDYFQYSTLRSGMPVLVLAYTSDKKWCFVQTSFVTGWVKAQYVAIGNRKNIKRIVFAENQLVVTGDPVNVYSDDDFSTFVTTLRMGDRLPFVKKSNPAYVIQMPFRNEKGKLVITNGYIKETADVYQGYLPYSKENVMRQVFKLKNEQYGWGGMFGVRDCSRFIKDVFACFGFSMPRNSYWQSRFINGGHIDVSKMKDREKIEILKQHENVPTLLYLKGHIMIFLGVINNRVYAIHNIWAYSKPIWFKDRTMYVGKVVVSDLSIGKGSKKGSLLKRLEAIVPMDIQKTNKTK